MKNSRRFDGTLQYIYAHWPAYLAAYGGIILALMVIGVSSRRGWLAFIPLALAFSLVLAYFLLTSLWAAHQQYDRDGLTPHHILFDMAQLQAHNRFVYINLGIRQRAISLSRRLTTGQIMAIDVYNPQWTPGRALARWRARMPRPAPDPRLAWSTGQIDLLPLPDESISVVLLCQVASEFWQHGDRLILLQEIRRILMPNGRLLLAERVRSEINWMVMGPAAPSLRPPAYWRALLTEAGFHIQTEKDLLDLIHCFRANKPIPVKAQQLPLTLEVPST